jgi:hypothetical protein
MRIHSSVLLEADLQALKTDSLEPFFVSLLMSRGNLSYSNAFDPLSGRLSL